MGRTYDRSTGLILGNLQGRILIQRRKTQYLCEQKLEREDVNSLFKGAKTCVKEKIPIKPRS